MDISSQTIWLSWRQYVICSEVDFGKMFLRNVQGKAELDMGLLALSYMENWFLVLFD